MQVAALRSRGYCFAPQACLGVWKAREDRARRPEGVPHHADRPQPDTIAEWMANLVADPSLSVAHPAPARGWTAVSTSRATRSRGGDGVWSGILDDEPDGACNEVFDIFTTSRIEGRRPISGDIYKCHLMPVRSAVVDGVYGGWTPSAAEIARLEAIFPDGAELHRRRRGRADCESRRAGHDDQRAVGDLRSAAGRRRLPGLRTGPVAVP